LTAGASRRSDVSDEFDVAVHDAEALAEIELLTNLIIATSEQVGRLSQAQIDEILGVSTGPQPTCDAPRTAPESRADSNQPPPVS
jgi:hypothetical protein